MVYADFEGGGALIHNADSVEIYFPLNPVGCIVIDYDLTSAFRHIQEANPEMSKHSQQFGQINI